MAGWVEVYIVRGSYRCLKLGPGLCMPEQRHSGYPGGLLTVALSSAYWSSIMVVFLTLLLALSLVKLKSLPSVL